MNRIVLIGDEYGLDTLYNSILGNNSIEIVGIICHKGKKAAESIATKICDNLNCEVILQPSRSEVEDYSCFVKRVQGLNADLAVCFSYDMILKKEVLQSFPKGIFNIHGALLPKYRGGNVLNWVIINGEKETGVTLHLMQETVDSGPIVLQKKVNIEFEDTALTLRSKLNDAGRDLLSEFWGLVTDDKIEAEPQNEEEATTVSKRRPEDGLFDWSWDTVRIYNMIRALVKPWPGAFYYENGKKITIDSFMPFGEVERMKKEKERTM